MLSIIFKYAALSDITVYVDAEYNWYNKYLNEILAENMALYNRNKAVIYCTVQTYLKNSKDLLDFYLKLSEIHNFIVGVKLVRGAYLNFENNFDTKNTYPCKNSVDHNYLICSYIIFANIAQFEAVFATHKIHSIKSVLFLREQLSDSDKSKFEFACLYGIGDNLIDHFSKKMSVKFNQYLPFGQFKVSTHYFLRRLEEGTLSKESFQREYDYTLNKLLN